MERLKHVLIIVGAIILGAFVNGFILRINGTIIPLPEGVDMKTPEGLQAAMKVLKPIHFLAPFLAHAIGTLIPAFIIAYFIPLRPKLMAIMTGGVFMVGGIMMVIQIPGAPIWFDVVDLVFAYIPMGLLGYYLAKRLFIERKWLGISILGLLIFSCILVVSNKKTRSKTDTNEPDSSIEGSIRAYKKGYEDGAMNTQSDGSSLPFQYALKNHPEIQGADIYVYQSGYDDAAKGKPSQY